ncbi:MAG: TaqI-like C-terminal specificity domain-containing protein [Promethearchaeota archaeon]
MQNNQSISELYRSVRKAIELDNILYLNDNLNQIDTIERNFLKNYSSRKNEGAYFTQKYISDYIVSQTLTEFFDSKLEEINIASLEELKSLNKNELKSILKLLKKTLICDPSCGSGVFLLSYIDIIFNLFEDILALDDLEMTKTVIIENIHAYDINEYSIKLCILKLLRRISKENSINLLKLISILESHIIVKDVIKDPPSLKFGLLIGNPPYGNILNDSLKQKLRAENVIVNEIYCIFILKALEWSNEMIGFLVPKSFLLRQGYVRFRKLLLSRANLLKIIDIGPNLFKKATNEVQIIIYQNKGKELKNLEVLDYPNNKIITYNGQSFDKLRICQNSNCKLSNKSKKIYVYTKEKNCPSCENETLQLNRIRIKATKSILDLIDKIENVGDLNYINTRDFPYFIRGEENKGLKEIRNIIKKHVNDTCLFINAKDDFNYYSINPNKSFDIESISPQTLKGRNYEYYTGQRLLIKHNNVIPQAIYTEKKACFTSSIYSMLHENITELKYLCGIINSALMQFYCIYGINNQKDTTINLNQYMIRHFPIIRIGEDEKEEISERVDFILNYLADTGGKYDDTTHYATRELDKIIFQIYSISKNEQELILSKVTEQISYFDRVYKKDYDYILDQGWTRIKRLPRY